MDEHIWVLCVVSLCCVFMCGKGCVCVLGVLVGVGMGVYCVTVHSVRVQGEVGGGMPVGGVCAGGSGL